VLIVGEGELREALERQIKDLGLERHVLLTGFRPDAIGLIKSFDVFVLSSITEGLGSAVLEAMAARRPVVATRAGGIPEAVIDGKTGSLVPPNDPDALADAIVALLKDPERRERLAAAGRERVAAEFSVEKMVSATIDVYRRRIV
jgi:glycosyltransferase involved in cell wall biosynthesis